MHGVWSHVKSKKKIREGKCEVSRENTQRGRIEHYDSELIK